MTPKSFSRYDAVPSAILAMEPLIVIPLWAVTTMTLSAAYHLPPIGSSGSRARVLTHDDTISLQGVLVGEERFGFKYALERQAENSRTTEPGLILVTSMTIRTDLFVKSLSFTATAGKRDAIDVSISLVYAPPPETTGLLLDTVGLAVGALADWSGN